MKNNEQLYLILGCFGRQDDGFVSCKGIENKILKVSSSVEGYNQMMDYFSSCRLFDRPLFELNSVRHLIFNLQDKYDQKNGRLWTEKNFTLYQKFIIDHRPCGVFVKLILDETTQETVKANVEEERILIKASKPVISYNNEVLTNSKTRKMGRLK